MMLTPSKLFLASSLLFIAVPLSSSSESYPPLAGQQAAFGGNQPPECMAGPDLSVTCQGASTVVNLDASASFDPDGDPLTFQWTGCPGSVFTSPNSAVTQIVLDTSTNCDLTCGVRLKVSDPDGLFSHCRLFIEVTAGDDGCSPGYWKNHADSWDATGFAPGSDFDTVFGVNAFSPDRTLMKALKTGGGGLNKLGRMATAALLNASHPGVAFPRTQAQVIAQVSAAIASGQYEPLATELDHDNNLGCPLN